MRRLLLLLLLFSVALFGQENVNTEHYQYLSPVPGSEYLTRSTNIIIKYGEKIDKSAVDAGLISVTGTVSGDHKGDFLLSDDGKTLVFNPYTIFSPNEEVTVHLKAGVSTYGNDMLPELKFAFTVTPLEEPVSPQVLTNLESKQVAEYKPDKMYEKSLAKSTALIRIKDVNDSLPSDFPDIFISNNTDPASGTITTATASHHDTVGHYIFMMQNDGTIPFYKKINIEEVFHESFMMTESGQLSYSAGIEHWGWTGGGKCTWNILDRNFAEIDTITMKNGYFPTEHDFILLPNGHSILIGYDLQPADLTGIADDVPDGSLIGASIIQELDQDQNVVFQWRAWDYIDLSLSYTNFARAPVDAIHFNSIHLAPDGNFLVSGRLISAILKINRETGEIMWWLGGKGDEFTYINETETGPQYFSYQHHARQLPNGNITFFDNRSNETPQYSRAVEYDIDETNKTVELVWEYRHTPDIFGKFRGGVQRLDNGNTLIGWGTAPNTGGPVFTEVDAAGNVVYEAFWNHLELSTQRVTKWKFDTALVATNIRLDELLSGNTYEISDASDTTGVSITINNTDGGGYNTLYTTRWDYAPVYPRFSTRAPRVYPYRLYLDGVAFMNENFDLIFDLNKFPKITQPDLVTVYRRNTENSGEFTPVSTSYNSGANTITASGITSFGEFILAYPDYQADRYPPILVYPEDSTITNVNDSLRLHWSPVGLADSYHMQVASDAGFSTIVHEETATKVPEYYIPPTLSEGTYYWRVNSSRDDTVSTWSDVYTFTAGQPYVTVDYPNGGEVFYKDSTHMLEWNDNINGPLKIELYKGGSVLMIIADSVDWNFKGYSWTLPDSIESGSDYSVKISSVDNSASDMSDASFQIDASSGLDEWSTAPEKFALAQNYPNPFNPSTTIRFSLPKRSKVSLTVFNALGQEVKHLLNGDEIEAGTFSVDFIASKYASGVYFYRLEARPVEGGSIYKEIRKMILLK